MSKIEELIELLCPDGVEFKTLGEIGKVCMCKRIFKEDTTSIGDVPFYKIGTFGKEADAYISKELYEEYRRKFSFPKKGDLLISASGTIGRIVVYDGRPAYFQDSNIVWIDNDESFVTNAFLFHYYQIVRWQTDTGGTIVRLYNDNIKKTKIPVPPLGIQNEIVSILDKFTLLEAELEAELEARKKQYEHYKEALLHVEAKNVEWKTLGEIGEFVRGNGLQKKDFIETGVGCIHYGQIYTHYGTFANKTKSFVLPELAKRLRKAAKNDLIIAGVSENVEDVCKAVVWLGDEEICVSGDTFVFKHKQNPKYIAYHFQTKAFFEFKKKYAIGAKVTRLQSGKLPTYKLPLPSLKEQERIASILEKFDALVNDISIGLPAELAARRKQYQYYRNRLLTFKNRSNG